jgi:phage-related protein
MNKITDEEFELIQVCIDLTLQRDELDELDRDELRRIRQKLMKDYGDSWKPDDFYEADKQSEEDGWIIKLWRKLWRKNK